MKKKMKILIAYDGSDCAEAALVDLRRAGLPSEVEAVVLTVADVFGPRRSTRRLTTPSPSTCPRASVTRTNTPSEISGGRVGWPNGRRGGWGRCSPGGTRGSPPKRIRPRGR